MVSMIHTQQTRFFILEYKVVDSRIHDKYYYFSNNFTVLGRKIKMTPPCIGPLTVKLN